MAIAKHSGDFNGELFAAIAALEQLAVRKLIRLEAGTVGAVSVLAVFAPTLSFQKG